MTDNAPSLQQKGQLPSNKRKWVYAVCCMATLFIWTDEFAFSGTMPFWQEHFGFTVVEAASVASMYTLTYACSQIYGGILGDMFGPKKILLICVVGVGCTSLGILVCQGYISMCLRNLIFGAFFGLFWGPCERLMSNWLPDHERGTRASVWGCLCGASQVYAAPLALMVAQHFGWRMSFIVVTALMVPLFIFVMTIADTPQQMKNISQEEIDYIMSDKDEEGVGEKASIGEIIKMYRHPWIILGSCATFLTNVATWMSATWISPILLKGYDISPTTASLVISPMSLIPVVAGLTVGPLLKTVFRGNIKMCFVLGSTIGFLAYVSPTFIHYNPIVFTFVIVGFGVVGNSYGFGGGNMWFNTMAPPKYQGTLNGMAVGLQGLIGFCLVKASGYWVTDEWAYNGYNRVFLITSMLFAAGIIIGLTLKTRRLGDMYTDGGYLD
jgi:sugar phosphate permease